MFSSAAFRFQCLFFTALVFSTNLSMAKSLKLEEISLLSVTSARMERSDVQGIVITGGALSIRDYQIAGAKGYGAVVGGSLNLIRGQIAGKTELQASSGQSQLAFALIQGDVSSANKIVVSNAQIRGTLTSKERPRIVNGGVARYKNSTPKFSVSIPSMIEEMKAKSAYLAGLQPNVALSVSSALGDLILSANQPVSVVSVTSSQLQRKHLVIQSLGAQEIVIQLQEASVDLSDVTVTLVGIAPENISWVMNQARSLMIQRTGDPLLGLPGFVYAPNALAQFYEGLITGGLYVETLAYIPEFNYKSGQINGIHQGNQPLN